MQKILVTGAGGQLGMEIAAIAPTSTVAFTFVTHSELDITNSTDVDVFFINNSFDVVINCAAYTAVDKAETATSECYSVNENGSKYLAIASAKYGFFLMHISTDFVFDGSAVLPLKEEDEPHPLSVYGASKWAGEKAIMAFSKRYAIFRTSWLYSTYGSNFVKTILRLAKEKSSLSIIADQLGTPTYATDLAEVLVKIAQLEQLDAYVGLYHYSNEGVASWYDFAMAICDISGYSIPILPIETVQYPTPAVRPKYSVMHKGKIKSTFGISIPYWRDSLKKCIQKINQ